MAAAQAGFITRAQLEAAGVGRGAIEARLRSGRLIRHHRGVYLYGRPTLEPLGREWAAVLACAGHGALGRWSAGALWSLTDGVPDEVWLTVCGPVRHSRPGLRVHRTKCLDRTDIRCHRGLPVTSPARTIVDLAPLCTDARLERLLAQAHVERLLCPGELERALTHRPGAGRLRALLEAEHGPAFSRSELERRLLELIRPAGLPHPVVNGKVLGFEVDFHWPTHRLIVETDGARFHDHAGAFETDRRRDQILVAAGWRVMRITWRQLVREPLAVLARLAAALATDT